jgi:hypothetical protein
MTRLNLALRGQLQAAMKAEEEALKAAPLRAVKQHNVELKLAARKRVVAAFPGGDRGGQRIGNAIRGKIYENQDGSAAGLVYSKAGRREGGKFIDLLVSFTTGKTVGPRRSRWLYIPVAPGQTGTRKRREKRLSVADKKNLVFIPARGGRKLYLVRQTRKRSTIIAVLVRRTSLPRRLDFDDLAAKAPDKLAKTYVEVLNEEADKR